METTDEPKNVLLKEITPRNLLSFGPETKPIQLGPLNVLIGPNGSGKSNLLEAIALLRATAGDVRDVMRKGGGIGEWIWKGGDPSHIGSIAAVVLFLEWELSLRHDYAFNYRKTSFTALSERIIDESSSDTRGMLYYVNGTNGALIRKHSSGVHVQVKELAHDLSILSQRRDPEEYPEVYRLANFYEGIRLFREWTFGRSAIFRTPQPADMRNDRLEEDFSNLGLFLSRLRRDPRTKRMIVEHLRDLYEGVTDFDVIVEGGTVQVFFTEGDYTIPATRLSDGTLRYLCLLAILCDPDPPPLICLEEPELGLHPDLIPGIADLLVEASERTQLIVTTHSTILVDALSEVPESVLVCEKHEGKTEIKRLEADKLAVWLEKYRLGQLWSSGEIGGNRW